MTSRLFVVLVLAAAVLVPCSLALASDAPAGRTAAAVVAQPQLLDTALSTAGPVCPRADLPALPPAAAAQPLADGFAGVASDLPPFLSPAQPLQTGGCGLCSTASCVGKFPNASCGAAGFRCIEKGFCGATAQRLCQCLII